LKVLLDTHAFLWWVNDDRHLSRRARRIIGDGSNEVYFSAVSGWEIAIKVRLGRLCIAGNDPEAFVAQQVTINKLRVLPIHLSHALKTYSLPDHHRDPFDRLLVAQSTIEALPLLSADQRLAEYRVRLIW
jgi:PIN domain nuclease of toxin-antitoxin system